MKKHPTDLVALLFGLAFTIAGALVLVTQTTSADVNPRWGAAVGLIVLGAVAMAVTLSRARRDAEPPSVSWYDEEP
jgi:hypothetical protein